ncbi:cell division protein ZapA [bacterium]|nr:cell division protein ZapA [bacterium]
MTQSKVKVEIYGNQYHIVADDDPDRVVDLANRVNARMKQIAGMNPGMSAAKVAILAALNFAGHAAELEQICNSVARQSDSLVRLITEELDD